MFYWIVLLCLPNPMVEFIMMCVNCWRNFLFLVAVGSPSNFYLDKSSVNTPEHLKVGLKYQMYKWWRRYIRILNQKHVMLCNCLLYIQINKWRASVYSRLERKWLFCLELYFRRLQYWHYSCFFPCTIQFWVVLLHSLNPICADVLKY